eukprot:tig00020941_g16239.t1
MAKTCVITGANRGIGHSFAKAFRKLGYEVIGTARKSSDFAALHEIGAKAYELDVTSEASVNKFKAAIGDVPISLLICNAGLLIKDDLGKTSAESMAAQFATNAIGPMLVAQALLPNLKAAEKARVVHMTSRMGSMDDNSSGGYYGYRASKAALNAVVKSMAVDLKEAGIPVIALHPGFVSTAMVEFKGQIEPDAAVEKMVPVIEALDINRTGKFIHGLQNEELPW